MGSSPIDRTNRKDDSAIVFFHFLMKMSWLCHVVDAHVRFARATQMQALDCPSLAVDRTKKITCTNYVQVIFYAREIGLERDVKKTAQCAVFSPRRVNRVSGAKKGVQNACVRKDCGASPIDRTNKKDDIVIVFFSFYRVLSFLFFDIMFYFVLLSSTFHGINSYISFKFLLQKCLECVLLHL